MLLCQKIIKRKNYKKKKQQSQSHQHRLLDLEEQVSYCNTFSLFPSTYNPAKLFQKAKPILPTQALRTAKSLAADLVCFYGAKAQN